MTYCNLCHMPCEDMDEFDFVALNCNGDCNECEACEDYEAGETNGN